MFRNINSKKKRDIVSNTDTGNVYVATEIITTPSPIKKNVENR